MDVNTGTEACVMNCSSAGLSQEETGNQTHTQVDSPRLSNQMEGCIQSLDWNTGLDYWTGLLDSAVLHIIRACV